MNNLEEFEKIVEAMGETPIFKSTELQTFYLGCMTKYLAQIADALNEIKEQEDADSN